LEELGCVLKCDRTDRIRQRRGLIGRWDRENKEGLDARRTRGILVVVTGTHIGLFGAYNMLVRFRAAKVKNAWSQMTYVKGGMT